MRPIIFWLLVLVPSIVFGNEVCVGDLYSGRDSPEYRSAFSQIASGDRTEVDKKKKRAAVMTLESEARRGNFFAAIFYNAIFVSKKDYGKVIDQMAIEIRETKDCPGVNYVSNLAIVPTYLGAKMVNNYWERPNLMVWIRSNNPYNIKEAARWLLYLNSTLGSDIWRESYVNIYRLGRCENINGALEDAEGIYKLMPPEWARRSDESRKAIDAKCAR